MTRNFHVPSLEELLQSDYVDTDESPFNIKNFIAFLVKSHCDENYEFWKSCNYYLNNVDEPTFDFVRWNTEIYENFIKVNAPKECNLPEDIRKAYRDWYMHSIIPSRDIVLRARQHTLNLMSDAYRQFIRQVNSTVDGETILKRSLTVSNATKNGATVSTSSTSTSSSRAASTGPTHKSLLSKGKALVEKFKRKTHKPALKKASSTGNALHPCAHF
ncbi:hypothetical protein HG537_0C03400 [Torulaspora globosa]|uniref:RGS domain-containing protein n=1 Tax=Torulaspora globosa TaxID=48254 RepID=A0A7H9HTK9_9SACH|nr:hypothetical protein HG537_0C03400 [Torulaspora sp. CBS 2947]